MFLFAIATLIPLPLFAAGAALGGGWALAALGYITLFVLVLDQMLGRARDRRAGAGEAGTGEGARARAATRLTVVLAAVHVVLLALAIAAVSGMTGLGWGARIALFFGFGLYFGQVSNSNAHELIHRTERGLHLLGMWVYITLLFGHHTSAHRHIHHRFVGTVDDPNTAVLGESFYAYAPRAWWGSFQAGAEIETALRKARRAAGGLHPYRIYLGGALACVVIVLAVFGPGGLIAYLLLAAYAQIQLLLSDYVQHYGLERRRPRGERVEPVGPMHSWNSGHRFSGALMLNAPRHSAHHVRPGLPFASLAAPVPGQVPMLPLSLPVMGAIALYPPLWHRMMDKRAARWGARRPVSPSGEAGGDDAAPVPDLDALGPEAFAEAVAQAAAKAEASKLAGAGARDAAEAGARAGALPAKPTIPFAAPNDDAAIAAAVAMTLAMAAAPEEEPGAERSAEPGGGADGHRVRASVRPR